MQNNLEQVLMSYSTKFHCQSNSVIFLLICRFKLLQKIGKYQDSLTRNVTNFSQYLQALSVKKKTSTHNLILYSIHLHPQ